MSYRPYMNRYFGVEIEMNEVDITRAPLSQRALRDAVVEGCGNPSRTGARSFEYYHSSGATWDVKLDGSCGYGPEFGYEVASPKLILARGASNLELRDVCEKLVALRPRINRKCGLHVNIDCSDYDWRDLQRLLILWTRYEPFFYSLQPVSRATNHYCKPLRAAEWGAAGWRQGGIQSALVARTERDFRYVGTEAERESGLNISSWWRDGRIEFRLGAGTASYEKIRRWAQLLLSLAGRIKYPYPFMPAITPAAGFMTRGVKPLHVFKQLGLSESDIVSRGEVAEESTALLAWVTERTKRFARARAEVPAGRHHRPILFGQRARRAYTAPVTAIRNVRSGESLEISVQLGSTAARTNDFSDEDGG